MIFRTILVALTVITGVILIAPSNAQTVKAASQAELNTLIQDAQKSGAKVVIIEAPGTSSAAPSDTTMNSMVDMSNEARENFRTIVREAPNYVPNFLATLRSISTDKDLIWVPGAFMFALIFLGIGFIPERIFSNWGRTHFEYFCSLEPASRSEMIAYSVFRFVMRVMGFVMQAAVAIVLVMSFDGDKAYLRDFKFSIIFALFAYRTVTAFFQNLLSHDSPQHRLLPLSDDQASKFYRDLVYMSAILAVFIGFGAWGRSIGLPTPTDQLHIIGVTFLATLTIAVIIWMNRKSVSQMILGPGSLQYMSPPRILLARTWHILAMVYFVGAFMVTAFRTALEQPNAVGLTSVPVAAIFLAIGVYGVLLLFIGWYFEGRKPILPNKAPEESAPEPAQTAVAEPADPDFLEEGEDTDAPLRPQKSFQQLFEKAAAILVTAGAIWFVAQRWGIDLADEQSLVSDLWEVLLILFISYIAYQAVKIAIDRKIDEEGGELEMEPGEEGGAAGASRLATLLPLFRNFLLIVIATITGMIVLSELGVDIAPLFAGAGVIGLAIGFGAQTLIRDIFSGAFFLMDDAFRRGEYIDIGDVKGTVEKISIRSMQLRHHMGPLNTVPFGEIQRLTNFSRDWVMMKLPLRLTYDTDVERVRKLIKNLGKELLEDEVIGDKFMQPLKSQGVYMMEDSAMIIRVKFMTKPGDQFGVRKVVYARIRELFEQEGIRFATREVTVRVADSSDKTELTEDEKEAVAGAVQPLIDQQAAPSEGGDGR